jgi:hypothetical protein
MQYDDILKRLKSLSDPRAVEDMAKYGITPERTYGVSIQGINKRCNPKKIEKKEVNKYGQAWAPCGNFVALPRFARSLNSGYEATAFGFRPNPRFTRTSHIRKTLSEIIVQVLSWVGSGINRWRKTGFIKTFEYRPTY